MFDRSRRDQGNGSAGNQTADASPGKATLSGALMRNEGPGAAPVQLKPAGASAGAGSAAPPAPAYEQATVSGPNKDKTINWDDQAAKYGIAGEEKASLRAIYEKNLRGHMATEPLMNQLGVQALLSSELGARIDGIADGSKPLWVGAVEKKGPDDARPYREALWRCAQRAIVDTLGTTSSDIRYKKDKVQAHDKDGNLLLNPDGTKKMVEQTYCNVYGADMVNAMGGYLPRVWYLQDDLKSPTKPSAEALQGTHKIELSANLIGAWLTKWGRDYGWRPTQDTKAAQHAANAGRVVIMQATNTTGSGHVNVILAEGAGHSANPSAASGYQPLQSQAGTGNFKYSDTAGDDNNSASWWAAPEMAKSPEGNCWIYEGSAHEDTSVASASNMGGKFGG